MPLYLYKSGNMTGHLARFLAGYFITVLDALGCRMLDERLKKVKFCYVVGVNVVFFIVVSLKISFLQLFKKILLVNFQHCRISTWQQCYCSPVTGLRKL